MPLVSVIIPYFKKINYIVDCINSVLSQSLQDFEIILVYDDIDLNDLVIIERSFKNIKNFRIIKNDKNYGAGISRNIGIKNAKGKILAFIDADDIWLPQKLEMQVKFMIENKYDFTFCNYNKKLNKKILKIESVKSFLTYDDLIKSCDIGLSTVQLSKKIIVDKNLFPSLKTKEDYVAWLKISKNKINAYNFPKNLVIWNKVENSLSSSFIQKIIDGFRVYRKFEKFGFLVSLYRLLILSLNSIKKKI